MSKHHEIEITRKGNNALPPKPVPDLEVGDTVHYFFRGADHHVTITFRQLSPFRTDEETETQVTDAKTETVQRTGRFQCGCRITLPNGTSIGWDKAKPNENPESGGEHHVKKR